MEYTAYIYNGEDISIIDYINSYGSILGSYSKDPKSFINYKGGSNLTNGDRIKNFYTEEDGVDESLPLTMNSLLKQGTPLLVDNSRIRKSFLVTDNLNLLTETDDQVTFIQDELRKLLDDPLYRPAYEIETINDTIPVTIPSVSVLIYSRALNKIIDVSSLVMNLRTTNQKLESTFTLQFAPIASYEFLMSDQIAFSSIVDADNKRSRYEFIQNFTSNDIVWIKFEKLYNEGDRKISEDPHEYSEFDLPDKIYDFIGLIDSVRLGSISEQTQVNVTINGRDLTKMLSDDVAIFMPRFFTIDSAKSLFISKKKDDRLLERVFMKGDYETLFTASYRTIPDTAAFIINQIGKLGILPKDVDLFKGYINTKNGDTRTHAYRTKNGDTKMEPLDGLWQIIKLTVDKSVENRILIDSSLSLPNGSLLNLFQKFCQEPLVELLTDTYGDKFHIIIRQPPFRGVDVVNYLKGLTSSKAAPIEVFNRPDDFVYMVNERSPSGLIAPSPFSRKPVDPIPELSPDSSHVITVRDSHVFDDSFAFDTSSAYSLYKFIPKQSLFGGGKLAKMDLPLVYFPEYAEVWGVKKMEFESQYLPYKSVYGEHEEREYSHFIEALINDMIFLIETASYLPFTRKGTATIVGDRRIKKGTWIRYEGTGEIFYVDSIVNETMISDGSISRKATLQLSRGMIEKYVYGVPSGKQKRVDTHGGVLSGGISGGMVDVPDISYFNIIDTDLMRTLLKQGLTKSPENINAKPSAASNSGVNPEVFEFFLKRKQFK